MHAYHDNTTLLIGCGIASSMMTFVQREEVTNAGLS